MREIIIPIRVHVALDDERTADQIAMGIVSGYVGGDYLEVAGDDPALLPREVPDGPGVPDDPEMAAAWEKYQRGEEIPGYLERRLEEWREDARQDALGW